VGAMGSRLVRRLLAHGFKVTVYDKNQSNSEALRADGAIVASTPAEVAAKADVILSCLTNDAAVRSVYLDDTGVFSAARAGQSVLEMSTISPKTSREVHAAGAQRGVNFLDVAISGSTPAVEQGTITLLAGGDDEVFHAAAPIFEAIAKQYFLMGPPGSGTTMKLVVNALLGIGMQAVAEAIALGEGQGLDRKRLLTVLAQTAVIAPAHKGKLAKAEEEDYSPQFGVGLMNKDFRLILEAAKSVYLELPATAAAYDVNSEAFKEDPNADFSFVIRQMERSIARNVSK